MNKPIIIDGCNVAECKYCIIAGAEFPECRIRFANFEIKCEGYNCYYKQLQHLKAENERLKAFKKECLKPVYLPDIEPEVTNKYKQALEEVRESIKNMCEENCPDLKNGYCIGINECAQRSQKHITRLIDKVLKDEHN